ncbi:hypothetical protein [Ornithinimicrobium kibberense]|uniref:Uncharacterized protein n=1 Tax=Ornithinimicrobium kibberense TaxID=282060 RepID=A0ABV5V6K3_9MICO|nr:hypothetical protein [Ornithinimicrobium kibberense]
MEWYLTGGVLTNWEKVRRLQAGMTYQWQDLDGFHQEELPETPPKSSLLHGWNLDGTVLVRLRWAGHRAYAARLVQHQQPLDAAQLVQVVISQTVPWHDLGQVAQAKGRATKARAQVFEHVEVPDMGRGGLLFLRPMSVA